MRIPLKSRRAPILPLLALCLLFAACQETPETFAIHSPIYPAANESVTFTLRRISGTVANAELFESVSTLDANGAVTATTAETSLQTWASPPGDMTFTKAAGYSANRMVNYRFVVSGEGHTYTHRISFVIRPYPVADMPAPVYVTGNQDKVMNLVFIPDTDMDLAVFRSAVFSDIRDAFQAEAYLRRFRSSHNFYINDRTGHAHDYDNETRDHEEPSNWANLSFAQGKVILHNRVIRDFAQGSLFSTEHFNRGTILHEAGHALYGMADEYENGVHWDNGAGESGNTWTSQANAQAAATRLGMPPGDANRIAPGSATDTYWELCPDNCMMDETGLNIFPYFQPCQDKILFAILTRATN